MIILTIEHSWVEVDNYVLDTTSKQVYNKKYYYKVFNPQAKKQYTHNDLKNEKTFLLQTYWSLKNREVFLEDSFICYFQNTFRKYENDK